MQEEQWQAAVDKLEAITTEQPALSGPWLNLGIACTKRGNSKAAEVAFKQAIDVNAANIEAYNQLGILYRRTGRYEEARHIYETALEIDPDNISLHWNLAILHDTDLPDPPKALLHYQRYQQITGSDNPHLLSWINSLAKDTRTSSLTARVNP
jgi:tetratricopeptide (TPR) repeat protein